jgi:putative endonuclease
MAEERRYYVYILTNRSGTLYTGSTNDIQRRVWEHKHKVVGGFTAKYNIDRLVFWEDTLDLFAARDREKQIKAWTRKKRVDLVNGSNPRWLDLAADWYSDEP